MFDMILESYGKAAESTLKLQREMLRDWMMQWSPIETQAIGLPSTGTSTSASATPAAAGLEQLSTAQTKWAEAVTDLLKRHRETLDEQYRAGIRALDDAFRVGEAKDPEQFRRLSEELWRTSFETLKTAVASQMHDIQLVMQNWYEACAWARRERKPDFQDLRIDRDDKRVCVRIVPRSRLDAGCSGSIALPRSTRGTPPSRPGCRYVRPLRQLKQTRGIGHDASHQPGSLRGPTMRRTSPQWLVVLGVLLLGLQVGWGSTLLAAPAGRASALTADERATLIQYARDTWRSFQSLVLSSGLPADSLSREGASWSGLCMQTSPTNIAAYLWSVLAAERLHLIGASEARSRLGRTLTTLEGMGRTHGLFPNELDPLTGATLKLSPIDSSARRPLLSCVDNAWLAVALIMVANAQPSLRRPCREVAGTDGFSVLLRSLRRRRSRGPSGTVARGLLGRRPYVLRPLRDAQYGGPHRQLRRHRPRPAPRRALLPTVPNPARILGAAASIAPRRDPWILRGQGLRGLL